ncbi:hypothetical protein [Curtobacterium herbarum]|uniref:Lipoprotein n=1 Tax=Curtobacterium herbarum TaxID=150122 RepID=A0ABN1ZCB4_9MICO|nr:hypothetical protein [Curtobacterium herbarum]MBM7477017.1 hypothetical protein [Curtobacterium herbarum]MCS6544973.1 hypothetical protein [Curtobacterium herbarum]
MGNLRTVRTSVVVVAVLATTALAGCSAGDGTGTAPSPSRTPSAAAAADPEQATPEPVDMDQDDSAAATCGQISALETVAHNAHVGLSRGELTQAQFDALAASVRFGFEQLVTSDAKVSPAVDWAQRYLEQHPGPTIDDTTADWELRVRTIRTACTESGSNIVVSAKYGG